MFHHGGPPRSLLSNAHVRWVDWTRQDGSVVPRPWLDPRELLEGLGVLVQIGGVELHEFGCTAKDLRHPDRLAFNLKPDPDVDWSVVIECALRFRRLAEKQGFKAEPRTSGGRELHVVLPLGRRRWMWDRAVEAATVLACELVAIDRRYTTDVGRSGRSGQILVDYRRNHYGNTLIAPYSPVAAAGFPVAYPVSWTQVERGVLPTAFTMESLIAPEADAKGSASPRRRRR